ncbi:TetR/AcrR family transcriptional regulator [Nonomuraea sp. NPDC049309]|jgi:AcrR family transcriptional regulator|uniref:TetR/AcrR family transcriptional regulator n=1 Tax=Nonomuraea sp. NPDC049309 TaxID=3364350 RepID=UPI0037113FD9
MSSKPFSSVWLREPRKSAAAPGRTREEIVAAAVKLLDEEGLQGLSMRKLGARLGAGATSLYWYVANKDELLELAYDQVWGEVVVPDPDEVGWRDAVSALAYGMRETILRHPWSADLIGRLPALGPNSMRVGDRIRRIFKAAGFRGLDVDFCGNTLTAYVFGMTIPEIAWLSSMGEEDIEQMRDAVRMAASAHPEMLESVDTLADGDPGTVRRMSFDFGLVSLLDGLERRRAS